MKHQANSEFFEHIQAVVEFWASQYKREATTEQMDRFKKFLAAKTESALSQCVWDVNDPLLGAYGRKFITYCDYHLSPVLKESATEAGLSASFLDFNQAVLAIDPDGVKKHPSGEIIWKP